MTRLYDAKSGEWIAEGDAAIVGAARWVARGGILAHPTSTVYGLGGRPDVETNAEVSGLKGRPADQPLIHVAASREALSDTFPGLVWTDDAELLARRFWPGALTLLLHVEGDTDCVAVRVESHPVLRDVLRRLGGAMTSTSLNAPGEPPAASARQALAVVAELTGAGRPIALLEAGNLVAAVPSTLVRVDRDALHLIRDGSIAWAEIEDCVAGRSAPPGPDGPERRDGDRDGPERMNILFVCTGNTCRSPAAEVLARSEAARRGAAHVAVGSAGTFAFPGQPAAGASILVAHDRGLDLESHRSRELEIELVEWATHIIVMTSSHRHAVEELVPESRVALLNDFLPDDHPAHGSGIADPFGGDPEVYEGTYRELEEAISALFDRLVGEAADAT